MHLVQLLEWGGKVIRVVPLDMIHRQAALSDEYQPRGNQYRFRVTFQSSPEPHLTPGEVAAAHGESCQRVYVGCQHPERGFSALQGSQLHSGSLAQGRGRVPSALVAVPFLPALMGLVFSKQGSLYGQILPAATFSLIHKTQHSIIFRSITKLIKTISWLITVLWLGPMASVQSPFPQNKQMASGCTSRGLDWILGKF